MAASGGDAYLHGHRRVTAKHPARSSDATGHCGQGRAELCADQRPAMPRQLSLPLLTAIRMARRATAPAHAARAAGRACRFSAAAQAGGGAAFQRPVTPVDAAAWPVNTTHAQRGRKNTAELGLRVTRPRQVGPMSDGPWSVGIGQSVRFSFEETPILRVGGKSMSSPNSAR